MAFETNIPVVKIIGEIINLVNSKIIATLSAFDPFIVKINYQYGHPSEILETLLQYDRDPDLRKEKFPLVMLVQDFQERIAGNPGDPYPKVSLRIIIAYHTIHTYKAEQRYANTFEPVLYPIYQALINELVTTQYIREQFPQDIAHVKTDRLYWGKEGVYGNEGNIANSYLDAIEITGLQLTINTPFCKFPLNP